MNFPNSLSNARSRGFSLVELLITISIIAVISVPLTRGLMNAAASQRNAGVAQSGVVVHRAVQAWMQQNQAFVAAQPMPYTITLAALQGPAVYLDPAFNVTNNAGQTPSVRVTKAADGSLEVAIAYTGGLAIKDGDLDDIAAYMVKFGAAGGSVQTGAGTVARGFQGSWVKDMAAFGLAPGAGHVVDFLTYSASGTLDDSLHRSPHPENLALNTMGTTLLMGGNAITGVSNVQFNAANQGLTFFGGGEHIVGTPDFGIGFQTNGGAERMRIYNDGHVAMNSYLALPAGQMLNVGGSYVYGDSANMALRPGANGGTVYLQGANGGGGTAHLSINGNITSVGEVYANGWFRLNGATGIYWGAYGGGWTMQDGTWIRAYNDRGIYTGGQVQAGSIQSNGTITAAGRIQGNEYILPVGGANIGGGCSPNGLLGRDAPGSQVVQCKDGVWTALGGWTQFTTVNGPIAFGFNNSVATCPAGWTAMNSGYQMASNPYVTAPGIGQSFIANPSQVVANTTDARVGVVAIATCAK